MNIKLLYSFASSVIPLEILKARQPLWIQINKKDMAILVAFLGVPNFSHIELYGAKFAVGLKVAWTLGVTPRPSERFQRWPSRSNSNIWIQEFL